ncbi:hypothetical protein ACUY3K_02615 [Corynebacterium uberis]|uniref:hypothetical protein n=1 Tax=Corynebacterium TaxID=1716 RepID=UPI001D0A4564|nr:MULTISPECIES: hypothetical protein [Corynebacterium]MCZ9309881.1 hypothetical protein [Corynebacterium sp. c6VSa_13]UDL73195.1 hypothetical protein LH391_08820 [Corynebacterium uberis]UDL75928.1 hypothetical protein LH393_00570 [Corynebacterium uberis]UDL78140.1 hypothetical protein LH394_00565 [Corynebacterium uberis]UDL80423.1 hypothetical protein LH392_00995 [Corynebacterium uberis]
MTIAQVALPLILAMYTPTSLVLGTHHAATESPASTNLAAVSSQFGSSLHPPLDFMGAVNPVASCVTETQRGPEEAENHISYRFIDVVNGCKTPIRLKVIVAFGPDSECLLLEP